MASPQPLFEAPAHANREDARGRLLLVSWHFPPAQSAGSLRWQKLCRFAAARGWAVDVITADPALTNPTPSAALAALPAGTRVFGVRRPRIWEEDLEANLWRWFKKPRGAPSKPSAGPVEGLPESLAPDEIRWRLTGRDLIRAWTAWLEFRRDGGWARGVTATGLQLAARERYAAVISCGPPHLAHTAARRIAERLDRPLILDLRDPFATWRRLPAPIASPLWFRLARWHEDRAVARAALVVANTEPLRQALAADHPGAAACFLTVTNGYDEDDPMPTTSHGDRFTIAYAGAVYLDRDPQPLFRALAAVVRSLGLTPDQLGIEFIGDAGSYGDVPLSAMAADEGIGDYLTVVPKLPRDELFARLAKAAMLLSLPQDSKFAIPSKVFEYLRFDAWVLVLADRGSPTEELLRETSVDVVAPGDHPALVDAIRHRVVEFRSGHRPRRLEASTRLSRAHQAEILFSAIEAIPGVMEGAR